jgi:hypothetical protein
MNKLTVCVKCKYYYCSGKDIWYNQFCKASEREPCIDPVSGKEMYADKNDLGKIYFTDQRYSYCRDVNTHGRCQKYRPLSVVTKLFH